MREIVLQRDFYLFYNNIILKLQYFIFKSMKCGTYLKTFLLVIITEKRKTKLIKKLKKNKNNKKYVHVCV